jgi:hypothetical protein
MPIYKSTKNIFVDFGEVHDTNWANSNSIALPPKTLWDYSRELQIEDIDIWEVIEERGGAAGVYAAWSPYAEFYMIRVGNVLESKGHGIETYYGPGSQKEVIKRMKELGYYLTLHKIWVEPEDMWLYQ